MEIHPPRFRLMLPVIVRLILAVLLVLGGGCGRNDGAAGHPGEAAGEKQTNPAPIKLTEWSWLPASAANSAEVAAIPAGANLALFIPETQPRKTHSEAPGGIDENLNFVPTVRRSLVVDGGALVSKLGPITKNAHWGDWNEAWSDPSHKSRFGWGYCVTAGEVILPRSAFEHQPSNRYAQNAYEIQPFGDKFVLIRLDPAKAHRLCWLDGGGTTAAWIGSKAEVNGNVLERRADGWYLGTLRMSK